MMKKIMILFSALLIVFGEFFVSCGDLSTDTANDEQMRKEPSEGLEFIMNEDGTCFVNGRGSCTDMDIVIPSAAQNGAKVVGIVEEAFAASEWYLGDTTIKSVVIPEGVTYIDYNAFYYCKTLSSVSLPMA